MSFFWIHTRCCMCFHLCRTLADVFLSLEYGSLDRGILACRIWSYRLFHICISWSHSWADLRKMNSLSNLILDQWNFITTAGQSRGSFLEFTQQNGRKKRAAKCLSVTNVTDLLLKCLSWSWLKMFPGLLQQDLSVKGGWRSAKTFFKRNYCHACHTKFAVFFPLPSCCVSSLITHMIKDRIGLHSVLLPLWISLE